MDSPLCEFGPTRDVAGGENARRRRFEVGVDDNSPIHLETGRFRDLDARAHAESGDDQVGLDDASIRQPDPFAVDGASGGLKMEDDAVLLMESTNEVAEFGAQNALHRALFRRHDMDLDISRP